MKPQHIFKTKPMTSIKLDKTNTVLMSLLYTLLLLTLPMQIHAASISEELLKTEQTDTEGNRVQLSQLNQLTQLPSVHLTVSPKQCVAMQQGQRCYLEVNLAFQANAVDDYCLYLTTQKIALQCWKKAKQGNLSYAINSKVDVEFVVKTLSIRESTTHSTINSVIESKTQTRAKPLAKAKVKMAWVHEKKGKPRMSWRLF